MCMKIVIYSGKMMPDWLISGKQMQTCLNSAVYLAKMGTERLGRKLSMHVDILQRYKVLECLSVFLDYTAMLHFKTEKLQCFLRQYLKIPLIWSKVIFLPIPDIVLHVHLAYLKNVLALGKNIWMCSNWLLMCSTLCMYNWICTWAFSWMHLAHIHVAVHVYINCTRLSLWALSWGVYHTAASSGLLPSLLEKIICLASCQQDRLGKISHAGWNSAALIRESSHVLWVCSCWVSCTFTVLWHRPCAILRRRTDLWCFTTGRSSDAVYHTQFHLPSGSRERVLGFSSLFPSSSVFPPRVQKSSRVRCWSNAHEFTLKWTAFTFF